MRLGRRRVAAGECQVRVPRSASRNGTGRNAAAEIFAVRADPWLRSRKVTSQAQSKSARPSSAGESAGVGLGERPGRPARRAPGSRRPRGGVGADDADRAEAPGRPGSRPSISTADPREAQLLLPAPVDAMENRIRRNLYTTRAAPGCGPPPMTTYKVGQVADLLGVSTDTVRRWADGGRLDAASAGASA